MGDKITVTGETTLSNSFMGDTIQVCVVTRDLKRTMDGFVRLGVGPWRIFNHGPDTLTEQTYRGEPEPYSMKLALAYTGNSFWEIIQPLEGRSIYKDWLAEHGEGIHHVAQACGNMVYADRIRAFESRGLKMIQSGCWKGNVHFHYFGAENVTGMAIELLSFPENFDFPPPDEWYPAPPPGA